MKPHLKIKLRAAARAVPHWRAVIETANRPPDRLHPALDALFDRHGVPVWVTSEYAPADQGWTADEISAGFDRIYRLVLKRAQTIPAGLVEALRSHSLVEYVEVARPESTPLPHRRAAALSRRTDQRSRDAIGLPEAHGITQGHPEVVVGVLDTGVSTDHPDLRASMLPGRDFVDIIDGAGEFIGDYLGVDEDPDDDVGHGTHVAGIIGASGHGMPRGVAPRCKILPVRVLAAMRSGAERLGAGLPDNINVALKWTVDQGVDVINVSLGVEHTGGGLPHEEVVDYARRKGVTVVAAAGNAGDETLYYPGALPYVITVGAVDDGGQVSAFSNYGHHVDLVAPGTDIYSAAPDDGYAFATGTSQAAPFVAGAVALLISAARSRGAHLSDGQIKHLLNHTADRSGRRFKDLREGFGRLNVGDALRLLQHRLERPAQSTRSPRTPAWRQIHG